MFFVLLVSFTVQFAVSHKKASLFFAKKFCRYSIAVEEGDDDNYWCLSARFSPILLNLKQILEKTGTFTAYYQPQLHEIAIPPHLIYGIPDGHPRPV